MPASKHKLTATGNQAGITIPAASLDPWYAPSAVATVRVEAPIGHGELDLTAPYGKITATANAAFPSGTPDTTTARLALTTPDRVLVYAQGAIFKPSDATSVGQVTLLTTDVPAFGSEIMLAAHIVTGPPTTLLDGTVALKWSIATKSTKKQTNQVKKLTTTSDGRSATTTVELAAPGKPTLLIFCCNETTSQKTRNRAGLIVPHGKKLFFDCEPAEYLPITVTGLTYVFNHPVCHCGEGKPCKIMVVEFSRRPFLNWVSLPHPCPPCPTITGTADTTFNYDTGLSGSETGISGYYISYPPVTPSDNTIFMEGTLLREQSYDVKLVGGYSCSGGTGTTTGQYEFWGPSGLIGSSDFTFDNGGAGGFSFSASGTIPAGGAAHSYSAFQRTAPGGDYDGAISGSFTLSGSQWSSS